MSFAVSGFSGFVVQTDAYTLPVSLISFEVLKLGNSVKLIWVTAHEQNSLEFLVQQSVSGTDWVTLSTVVAAGNSNTNLNYNFLHKFPAKGMNYYRLIQKDIDGRSEISTVKQILFQTGLADVQIVNNPVHNGQFQVIINNGLQRVMLFNDLGQLVLCRQLGTDYFIEVGKLGTGVYLMKAGDKTERIIIH